MRNDGIIIEGEIEREREREAREMSRDMPICR